MRDSLRPSHRLSETAYIEKRRGDPGLNYACAGYQALFHHVGRPMGFMADRPREDCAPPAEIMQLYVRKDDPCTCAPAASGRSATDADVLADAESLLSRYTLSTLSV